MTTQKRRWNKLPKKFCVNTKGLTKDERKELATDLNDLVKNKKEEFEQRRQESVNSDQGDES